MSIAAASILAKVTRDRLMVEYDKVMPEYGFAGHKGYGSKEHIEAIKKYGPTPIDAPILLKFSNTLAGSSPRSKLRFREE